MVKFGIFILMLIGAGFGAIATYFIMRHLAEKRETAVLEAERKQIEQSVHEELTNRFSQDLKDYQAIIQGQEVEIGVLSEDIERLMKNPRKEVVTQAIDSIIQKTNTANFLNTATSKEAVRNYFHESLQRITHQL